jgi:hypothetical protein
MGEAQTCGGDCGGGLGVIVVPAERNESRVRSEISRERSRITRCARFRDDVNYPRPTNGILVAITVIKSTFDSSGRLAMWATAWPT